MNSLLTNLKKYNSGNSFDFSTNDDISGNRSLKFFNDNTNLNNRDVFETSYETIEKETNKEEIDLNTKNLEFVETANTRATRINHIDQVLQNIQMLKYDRERLKKYVVDGEAVYKFEINKVWVYSILNIGGCAAMLYMIL